MKDKSFLYINGLEMIDLSSEGKDDNLQEQQDLIAMTKFRCAIHICNEGSNLLFVTILGKRLHITMTPSLRIRTVSSHVPCHLTINIILEPHTAAIRTASP